MHKKTFFLALVAILLLSSTSLFAASSKSLSVPVVGTFPDSHGGTGTFSGAFAITQFVVSGGQTAASGILTGTLVDSTGTAVGSVLKTTTIPVSVDPTSSCEILHLDLGPLSLNLLGLQVNLSEVVLDISAQPGPGNLLGNLLCAIANLLNGAGSVSTLTNLLNQVLQAVLNLLG